MVYEAVALDVHESIDMYHFMHALLGLEYPHIRDCHDEGNVQLLENCILRLSGRTSLIVGYVKKAHDFRNGPDKAIDVCP